MLQQGIYSLRRGEYSPQQSNAVYLRTTLVSKALRARPGHEDISESAGMLRRNESDGPSATFGTKMHFTANSNIKGRGDEALIYAV